MSSDDPARLGMTLADFMAGDTEPRPLTLGEHMAKAGIPAAQRWVTVGDATPRPLPAWAWPYALQPQKPSLPLPMPPSPSITEAEQEAFALHVQKHFGGFAAWARLHTPEASAQYKSLWLAAFREGKEHGR